MGRAEGVVDVRRAEGGEWRGLAQGAAFALGDGLVHDVPLSDASLEVSGHTLDVPDHRRVEALAGERLGPGCELVVPDEGVPTNAHPVLAREGDEGVARGEVEAAGVGLDGLPFHFVLRRERIEVRRRRGAIAGIAEVIRGDRRADVAMGARGGVAEDRGGRRDGRGRSSSLAARCDRIRRRRPDDAARRNQRGEQGERPRGRDTIELGRIGEHARRITSRRRRVEALPWRPWECPLKLRR